MIDAKKMNAIELRVEGKGNTEIAKLIGVSRTTIWTWFNDEEVKVELNRFEREIKTHAQNKFNAKTDKMIDHIEYLALHAESEKVQSDNTQYWVDRVLGTPSRQINITAGNDEDDSLDKDLLEDEFADYEDK